MSKARPYEDEILKAVRAIPEEALPRILQLVNSYARSAELRTRSSPIRVKPAMSVPADSLLIQKPTGRKVCLRNAPIACEHALLSRHIGVRKALSSENFFLDPSHSLGMTSSRPVTSRPLRLGANQLSGSWSW